MFRLPSKKFLVAGVIIAIVSFFVIFAVKKYPLNIFNKPKNEDNVIKETKADISSVKEESKIENSTNEKDFIQPIINADINQLQSENFKMDSVIFGGDTALLVDNDELMPIEISEVKNEAFLSKKGDESKIIISWKSNKLTMSEVTYAKNNGQNPKTISDGGFGFSHSVIITGLEMGTGYLYKIKSTDRWNNTNETDYFGFYSGSQTVSVFQLIAKEFQGIFGWAIK